MRCTKTIDHLAAALTLMLLLCTTGIYAEAESGPIIKRGYGLGTVYSADYVGVCLRSAYGDGIFNSFDISVDLYKVIDGRHSNPGYKAEFIHNYVLTKGSAGGIYPWRLYAGVGAAAGYVRDVHDGMGVMVGVAGDIGAVMSFRNRISLAFEWRANVGTHITGNASSGRMSFYAAGLTRAWIPRLRIIYDF